MCWVGNRQSTDAEFRSLLAEAMCNFVRMLARDLRLRMTCGHTPEDSGTAPLSCWGHVKAQASVRILVLVKAQVFVRFARSASLALWVDFKPHAFLRSLVQAFVKLLAQLKLKCNPHAVYCSILFPQ